MNYTPNEIEVLTGIKVDSQRRKLKQLFPDQSFDRSGILNGKTQPMLTAFLDSNRITPAQKRKIKKILLGESDLVKPSKGAVKEAQKDSSINWRNIIAVLPLPMLGLAASYGVYFFASQFVPAPVAITEAAAFELTYIGLASMQGLKLSQQITAKRVAIGAVVVSVIYNTLAGAIHQNELIIQNLTGFWFWGLSVVHGAPLAVLAYFVADLIFHTQNNSYGPKEK